MRPLAPCFSLRRTGLWAVVLCAIVLAQSALASSYVRFANASIQPERSATVDIRLDGISVVQALAYKGHTSYIERASGNMVVSAWRGNSLLLQRTVALRDGNQYLFLVYGGGATGKPYDLYPLYEGSLPIASNAAPIEYFQLAPYPWVVNSIGFSLSCLNADGQTTRDTATRSYPSNFPIEIGGAALKTLTPAPGNCVANIATAITNQVRTGAIELEFTPTTGSRHHVVAVGDGTEQTPLELWVFSQPARTLEGPPRPIAEDLTGMWVAPAHPGLAISLERAGRRIGSTAGLLTGVSTTGKPRWYRLDGFGPADTQLRLSLARYQDNQAEQYLAESLTLPFAILSFQSCDRARLQMVSLTNSAVLDIDIAAFRNAGTIIELRRVVAGNVPCAD